MNARINARQQLYKKNRLEGMSQYAAARKAGYSHATAINAHKIEKRCDFGAVLEMAGLTDKALAVHAAEGLAATKKVSLYYESEANDDSGYTHEEVPDWQSRHKYFESICKLRGKIKETPLIDQSTHTHFTVVMDGTKSDGQADSEANGRLQTSDQL